MKILIEKDVPFSSVQHNRSSVLRQTMLKMNLGESFVIPDEIRSDLAQQIVYQMKNRSKMQFAIRKTAEGKYRVWRIK